MKFMLIICYLVTSLGHNFSGEISLLNVLNAQGSANAVRKSCGCLLVTSVANYKVHCRSPVVTIATDDADYAIR